MRMMEGKAACDITVDERPPRDRGRVRPRWRPKIDPAQHGFLLDFVFSLADAESDAVGSAPLLKGDGHAPLSLLWMMSLATTYYCRTTQRS